jgi:hypothetical protein
MFSLVYLVVSLVSAESSIYLVDGYVCVFLCVFVCV